MEHKNKNFTPSNGKFDLISEFSPKGDQPKAIEFLDNSLNNKKKYQTLLGVTGSGKTYTIANIIKNQNRPVLVIAPNKTLAAQLYNEFKEFFPNNNVEYFVSYYDYYQPEAYIPSTDTYIEKDSAINEEIDKLRHSSTRAVIESRDTIIVASVSCIYGLGAPEEYFNLMLYLEKGEEVPRADIINQLVYMQYTRTDTEFKRGTFRVRGEVIDIFPSDKDSSAFRLQFFCDEIEEIFEIDSITGKKIRELKKIAVYPLSHFLTSREAIDDAIIRIKKELKEWLPKFRNQGKQFEAERLKQRTLYDLELLKEVGICPGIENYSRHLAGRGEGEPPTTLIDYFQDDYLLIIDESHITLPQISGMYRGDQARKQNLVEYGFRLPSAKDNRPLSGEEFWQRTGQVVFVSATPSDKEIELSKEDGGIVEQINRPTGLLDPIIEVRPATNQVDDLLGQIHKTVEKNERVIVTTLTKKMAEELASYFRELGIKSKYLHSEINTIERVELIKGFRKGDFDVLIGINLLREGLDLVEVSLVAILDADKEGFLRSTRSLIQTIGRASRNINGRAIFYADKITKSMKETLDETKRRREIQSKYNQENNITPYSAKRQVDKSLEEALSGGVVMEYKDSYEIGDPKETAKLIEKLKKEMLDCAAKQEFESASVLRDKIKVLEKILLET